VRNAASPVVLLSILLATNAGLTNSPPNPAAPEILRSTDALPFNLVGPLLDPYGYAETAEGDSLLIDRRAHAVMAVDRARTVIRPLLTIGQEIGKVLEPGVLSVGANGVFAVADAPGGFDRVQYFSISGTRLGGFYLPRRTGGRLLVGSLVLNGISSMQFTGKTFLVNLPASGALISEFDVDGLVTRRFGVPRPTGAERDPTLHQALNIGLPVVDPTGGFYFVFQSGVPIFRKYDATGRLLFERHIEGPELDVPIGALPTVWPARPDAGTNPLVPTLVRAAAVDAAGRLYISLSVPYTYVYDPRGEKIRTLQLTAAGVVAPATMTFSQRTGRLLVTPGCFEFDVQK
jgi:hypothetical protein